MFRRDSGIFPLARIRSRIIYIDHYAITDTKYDYTFIHITLKVGVGRDVEIRKVIEIYFQPLKDQRLLAIFLG